MKVLIVNPNSNAATTELLVSVARNHLTGTAVTVVGVTAAAGPMMITSSPALSEAATQCVAAALLAISKHQPDAVIIGAFGDPGADELRSLTDVLVVGIGYAAVVAAADAGRRFAIATTTERLDVDLRRLVHTVCPEGDFAGIFYTLTGPLTLAGDPDASVYELGVAVDAAVAAGAAAVIIGGGPLSNSARALAQRTDVEIIEPIPCAIEIVMKSLRTTA